MGYFDLAKASRPLLEKERVNLDIPHWMILKIDRIARRKGLPRQAQIKEWLSKSSKRKNRRPFSPAGIRNLTLRNSSLR